MSMNIANASPANNAATVQIVPNKSGALITAYKSNADFGFIHLQSVQLIVDGAWLRESKRSALFRGKVSLLEQWMKLNAKGTAVAGRICVSEFVESQIPMEFQKDFNSSLTYEENISPLLKRAGENGPVLTKGGERIVRFSKYDPTGTSVDTLVKNDAFNAPEQVTPVQVTPAQTQEKPAELPQQASDAADDIIAETGGADAPF